MKHVFRIAAYARISVDEEIDSENTSIENQKSIISEFVKVKFPTYKVDYFEDRDKSGYTFEQRSGYQAMRKMLISGYYKILIIKDFSRFSRRNSKGLVELEDLRDAGVRIIAITDNTDFPTNDDWLSIQFRFLMNEIPVTDTSKKVKTIIANRQKKGEWICNAPYGYYLHPTKKNEICIDEEGARAVKLIFDLYNKGDGYKKIAHYLTEHNYPTALMLMEKQLKAKGTDTSKLKVNPIWSHISVAKIVKNDFYIGTLRQNVWSRAGINKKDVRVDESQHIVFENHHEPIIDKEVFERAQEAASRRTTTHYKGIRKYNIPYSGFIFCEDCGSPMFSISNPKRPPAYTCGAYHRRGLKGCTSHHIHEQAINESVRTYIATVRDNLQNELVNMDIERTGKQVAENKKTILSLNTRADEIKLQLQESTKQRLRQIIKDPQNESIIAETFDSIDKDFHDELRRINAQIEYLTNEAQKKAEIKKNINKVLDTFEILLSKDSFSKEDISLIIEKIMVDNDKVITIQLKSGIDEIFDIIGSKGAEQ